MWWRSTDRNNSLARFRPFRALRYDASRAGDLGSLVAPPYDVISPEERDAFYDSSPYNVARLILNRDGHPEAGRLFREWNGDGLCVRDQHEAFYLYAQDFNCGGTAIRRTGVIGALCLEPFSRGVVRPHERTFGHHKADRLELTRETHANLSPIFGLYSNPDFTPEPDGGWDSPADIDVEQDGVRHRLWTLVSEQTCRAITEALSGREVFIADGHHRYETALAYYADSHEGAEPGADDDAAGDEDCPEAHVMAFLAAFEDPGMVILPTHRELVGSGGAGHAEFERRAAEAFQIDRFERSQTGARSLMAELEASPEAANVVGVALSGLDHYLLLRRDKQGAGKAADLDVSVLHEEVIDRILAGAGASAIQLEYNAEAESSLAKVEAGSIEGLFLLRATNTEQLSDVCRAGELMPHKSTYFYPKLLSGFLFHTLETGGPA